MVCFYLINHTSPVNFGNSNMHLINYINLAEATNLVNHIAFYPNILDL